jgi:hypothetical protein
MNLIRILSHAMQTTRSLNLTMFTLMMLCLGCSAGPSRIEGIAQGMSKAQVIEVLGEPRSTETIGGSEYLTFKVWRSFWRRQPGNYRDVHYVQFVGGRVIGFADVRTLPQETRARLGE